MNITMQEISASPSLVIAGTRGSAEHARLTFTFDEAWEGLAKKVLFLMPDGKRAYRSCRDGEIVLPRELMQQRGKSRCYVIGRRGKKRLVSMKIEILVLDTPVDEDGENEVCSTKI